MFLVGGALSGIASVVAMESGWVVTEVGRQPWTVYHLLLTSQAATTAGGVLDTLAATLVIYGVLTVATFGILWLMKRRWQADSPEPEVGSPYAPPAGRDGPRRPGAATVIADTVAAVLVVVSTAYAVLAGADFGGGIWDLLAGSAARGERAATPHRPVHRAGVGSQPRLAGHRPGRASGPAFPPRSPRSSLRCSCR